MSKKADYKKPDHWARKARADGYAARSVFKLEEIDRNEGLIRPGHKVLDLGACPGSWMQYLSKKVGKDGLVFGVDIKDLERELRPNERFIKIDVEELGPETVMKEVPYYDAVVSDMMPNTIGHRASDHYRSMALAERALWMADQTLRRGGTFLVKVFQGADFEQYRGELRSRFDKVKIKKPESSRKTSREIFFLATGKKGRALYPDAEKEGTEDG